jgi:xanthine/uracil permease
VRPLAVLLGIITGSCVAIAVALAMTGIVFLFLPEYAVQVNAERRPLLVGIACSWALSALAGTALLGELRTRAWRRVPQALLLVALAMLAWRYWPK